MKDPDFEGSIFQKLGFDAELCERCGAHLCKGICLNACHLSEKSRRRFQKLMEDAVKKASSEEVKA